MTKAEEIIAVMDTVFGAYRRHDASAVVESYAPDAVIFDLAPPLAKAPDRDAVAAWLGGWSGPVSHEVRDLDVALSGDLAFAHGLVRVMARTKAGEDAHWWMRMTVCLRRTGEDWTIVHEHTSVPFHMDGSYLAATDLEP